MLIYLHGFNSSSASWKARCLAARLAALGCADQWQAPDLPPAPAAAIRRIDALLDAHPAATLVGSSLGGYYATYLAEQRGLRAVLINPAVAAPALLAGLIGAQRNLYTGEHWELTAQHVAELQQIEVTAITRPERYLLLQARGDEVLDWRLAARFYAGATQHVIDGGDHGFSDFEPWIDRVLAFAGTGPDAH